MSVHCSRLLSLTCECPCIAQVDTKLSSFVDVLSEVSSLTDANYGPESIGVGESEISSVTNPTYDSASGGEADAGVGEGANEVADAAVMGVGVDAGSGSESDTSDTCATWVPDPDDRRVTWWTPDRDDGGADADGGPEGGE